MAGTPSKRGGVRTGAGRKPAAIPKMTVKKEEVENLMVQPASSDPKTFLLSVMDDNDVDARIRMDAAKALMPFMHLKLGEGGKKEQKQDATKAALGGKFAVKPTLVHSK